MLFFIFIKTRNASDIRQDTEGKPRLELVVLILIKMLNEKEITDAGWQQFFTQVGGFYNIKKYNDRYSTECLKKSDLVIY